MAVGTARLSVIDLEGGGQPIAGESGRALVVLNGEIYNFLDLRAELEQIGHRFTTRTDTEVVVHAYEEWGLDGIRRLKGMFGLAVVDRDRRRVLLARDPAGEKPLFYVAAGDVFAFASEMKPLLPFRPAGASIDRLAAQSYFLYARPVDGLSAFPGIEKVAPGAAIEVDFSGRICGRFTHWTPPAGKRRRSVADAERDLHDVLEDAVRRCMVADVPVGALLSGGVDSALVTALAQAVASAPLKTFTVVYDDPHISEGPEAAAIAERLGTEHHEVPVRPDDVMSVLPRLVWHLEEPFADASAVPAHVVTALARRHVTVALTGDGGDELFGGYDWYRAWRVSDRVRRLPPAAARVAGLARYVSPGPLRRWPRLYHYANGVQRVAAAASIDDPVERFLALTAGTGQGDLVGPGPLAELLALRRAQIEGFHADDELDLIMYFQYRGLLPELFFTKLDRMSMMSSLECRAPLVYRDVVEFALQLPVDLKVSGTSTKLLLKRVLERYLPERMIYRPKRGFSIPLYRWLREHEGLRTAVERFSSPTALDELSAVASLDPKGVQSAVRRFLDGETNDWTMAWRVVCFGLWLEMFVKGDGAQPLHDVPSA